MSNTNDNMTAKVWAADIDKRRDNVRRRQLIAVAEAGDYNTDYALRCFLIEYLDRGDYRDLPEEMIAYMQRALFRDVGQTIEQAIEVCDSGTGREILKRGLPPKDASFESLMSRRHDPPR